jgi:hypothetical protein
MSDKQVQVTAEWALWGKEPHDVEYRLLRCSDGPFSARNFEELITRYSPGTLEALPQVSVAWAASSGGTYLAMIIHRSPRRGLYDASGRKVVLTYCFCVPFGELAAGPVSYRALYDALRERPLPAAGAAGLVVDLPAMSLPAQGRRQPMVVANLLLTNLPVCILGADRVDLDTRLAFIDAVMALLPYGLRATLSASTWTNSIFEEHKFRLFFTSAKREAHDHVLTWNPGRVVSVRHEGDGYLPWICTDTNAKMQLLATRTRPHDFRDLDAGQLVRELQDAWRGLSQYEADAPYSLDETRPPQTRLQPTVPLPAGHQEGMAVEAGGAVGTAVAARPAVRTRRLAVRARPPATLAITREVEAVASFKRDRYARRAHDATGLAVKLALAVIVVAGLVLVLATVR